MLHHAIRTSIQYLSLDQVTLANWKNQKFLRALGYLSNFDNPEQDEKIQMHADTLYHRMLDQEKAIETAKAEGQPIPKFPPLMSSAPIPTPTGTEPNSQPNTPTTTTKLQPSDLPPEAQEQIKERLKGLKDDNREVEERAILEEIWAGEKVAGKLGSIYEKEREERRKRREEGKETLSDKVSTFFTGRWSLSGLEEEDEENY